MKRRKGVRKFAVRNDLIVCSRRGLGETRQRTGYFSSARDTGRMAQLDVSGVMWQQVRNFVHLMRVADAFGGISDVGHQVHMCARARDTCCSCVRAIIARLMCHPRA
jgi:hypothetical protein